MAQWRRYYARWQPQFIVMLTWTHISLFLCCVYASEAEAAALGEKFRRSYTCADGRTAAGMFVRFAELRPDSALTYESLTRRKRIVLVPQRSTPPAGWVYIPLEDEADLGSPTNVIRVQYAKWLARTRKAGEHTHKCSCYTQRSAYNDRCRVVSLQRRRRHRKNGDYQLHQLLRKIPAVSVIAASAVLCEQLR